MLCCKSTLSIANVYLDCIQAGGSKLHIILAIPPDWKKDGNLAVKTTRTVSTPARTEPKKCSKIRQNPQCQVHALLAAAFGRRLLTRLKFNIINPRNSIVYEC